MSLYISKQSNTHLLGSVFFFFFNDTATTEIYTLSLHDALPIWKKKIYAVERRPSLFGSCACFPRSRKRRRRSEEHTSELQSQSNLVCRLLLEKKKIYHLLQSIPALISILHHLEDRVIIDQVSSP